MENKFENQFCKIDFSREKNCLYHFWKPTTKTAGWAEIKNAFLKYVDSISQSKPKSVVVDERDMGHVFSPEEQKWVDNEMMPKIISAGMKKIAIIKSKDAFVELATELMMGEENASRLQLKFIQTLDEAEAWISK
jgi:hypothetical protein